MSGKGFTVKKDWDNPREHAMPDHARVPASLRIANVQIAPATVLAPMVGVTDTVFRRFIRHASLFTTGASADVAPFSGSADAKRYLDGEGLVKGHDFSRAAKAPEGDGALAPEVSSAAIEATVTNAQSGCGLLMTEFTSADGLARMRESKRKRYLTFYDDEHPIGAQLFGSNSRNPRRSRPHRRRHRLRHR